MAVVAASPPSWDTPDDNGFFPAQYQYAVITNAFSTPELPPFVPPKSSLATVAKMSTVERIMLW